jgi:hypothetical protein
MLENIILIIIILLLLNNIKIKSNDTEESFTDLNVKYNYNSKIPIYGDIQYDVFNNDNDDKIYKHQNYQVIDYHKNLELSDKVNLLNDYNNLTKLNSDMPKPNFINSTMPSEQDIIYDTKFFQPSDAEIHKPFDKTTIKYEERTIQDVYDELVNKKVEHKKLKPKSETKVGMFGEKTLNNLDWEYENEDDGMSYDPNSEPYLAIL